MGASDEAHGPALPRQIDDYMAVRTAIDLCMKQGFFYRGHIPYCGDRIGEIAKDWCPAYMDNDLVIERVKEHITDDMTNVRTFLRKNARAVAIINGHNGNDFLKQEEQHISNHLNVPFTYLPPFEDATISDERLGNISVNHADIGEHSIAAFLGLLDNTKLDSMNGVAARDPNEALKRWPAIAGLGGYRLLGGSRYDILRESKFDVLASARRFITLRKMIADYEIGKELYEKNLKNAYDNLRKFVARLNP
jgi:hypothetical protein